MCVWEMGGEEEGGGWDKREGERVEEKEWWKKEEKNWLSCSFAFRAIVTLLFNLNETGFHITQSSTHTHIHTSCFVPCVEGAGYLTTAEKKEMDEKREEECKMADSFI